MRLTLMIFTASSLASATFAGELYLTTPVDCTLGQTCYIQHFVDSDPSPNARDFTCGYLTYDGHTGTDFALPTTLDMWGGVDVLAAADGIVTAMRSTMPDHPQDIAGAPNIKGQECGNGIVIDHGEGWVSQYCHVMMDSLLVETGDTVIAGQPLAQIGLSGLTEFPHMHFVVRQNNQVIDPFNPSNLTSCTQTHAKTLWKDPMVYEATGLLSVGISPNIPAYEHVKSGTAHVHTLPAESSSMVVYGFAFGGLTGDIMDLSLTGPEGQIAEHQVQIDEQQSQYFRAVGRERSTPWPEGAYNATVSIIRDETTVSEMTHSVRVGPQ